MLKNQINPKINKGQGSRAKIDYSWTKPYEGVLEMFREAKAALVEQS